MNREQRRRLAKELGLPFNVTDEQTDRIKHGYAPGDKVMLDMKRIGKTLKNKTKAYQDWVMQHQQDVFTVKTASIFEGGAGYIYSLEEDDSAEKWMFHSLDLKRA